MFVYIDDLLISSRNETEHKAHLREVMRRLAKHNLSINLEKCEFARSTLDYLGHRITASGIEPRKEKVDEILNFPKPDTVVALKRFIGSANFYRRFLKNAAEYLAPLDQIATTKKKNDRSPVDARVTGTIRTHKERDGTRYHALASVFSRKSRPACGRV